MYLAGSSDQHVDCFFCTAVVLRYRKSRDREKLFYSHIPLSIAPVCHNPNLTISQCPFTHANSYYVLSFTSSEEDYTNFEDDVPCSSKTLFNQQKTLDDLVIDLGVTKA